MEAVRMRKSFQGVLNIIRFNRHFYIAAVVIIVGLLAAARLSGSWTFWICLALTFGLAVSTLMSLCISYYVYDLSGLYRFAWLGELSKQTPKYIVNVHAGFDETSIILKQNFPAATLRVFDFYDPKRHTEISIERARRAYPPFEETAKISTAGLSVEAASIDIIFNIFALHEIRERGERVEFLRKQAEALKLDGRCVVVEHLRDIPNFLAYNIGFLHFFSQAEWTTNFTEAKLVTECQFRITPFVTVYILKPDGNTH